MDQYQQPAPWDMDEDTQERAVPMDMDNVQENEDSDNEANDGNDVDDSSEEEEEDEDAIRKVQDGFIVGDEEEEEEEEEEKEEEPTRERRRHKKHHGKKRERHSVDEDEDDMGLDEDDIELLQENTGVKISLPTQGRLNRIGRKRDDDARKRRRIEDDDINEDDVPGGDLWNDTSARVLSRGREEEDDDEDDARGDSGDEMRDFIEEDEEEEENDMGEAERQERRERKQRLEREREKQRKTGKMKLSGSDQAVWAEILEVFGDGEDYAWAMGDEDEDIHMIKEEMAYTDIFEPSEIAGKFLTQDDDLIRAQDIPERMQLATSSLSTSATLAIIPPLGTNDFRAASQWVAARMGPRIQREFFRPLGSMTQYVGDLLAAIQATLEFLFLKNLEVPYIMVHKRDFLWHISQSLKIELLGTSDLWRIYALGQKYRALLERKNVLLQRFKGLGVEDKYFETVIMEKLDTIETVGDTTEWLATKYHTKIQDIDQIEDGFTGIKKTKRPTRVSEYDVLNKTSVSKLAKEFDMSADKVATNLYHIQKTKRPRHFTDDPDLAPLEHARPYVQDEVERLAEIERKRQNLRPGESPAITENVTPEMILKRARLLLAVELSKDPLLRQEIRERFKNAAEVSCHPTEKGLVKIDDNHPFYAFKYLQRKPVSALTRSPQFLHILAAESDHLITVTVSMQEEARLKFIDELIATCKSDSFAEQSKQWNELRAQVVTEALDAYLIPFGAKYVREWLKEEVEDYMASVCGQELERRVNVRPLFPSAKPDDIDLPNVMAISWGQGDPKKDPITIVCLDERGRLREHTMLDNFEADSLSEFYALCRKWRPDVIVIAGFSDATHKLWGKVRAHAKCPEWRKDCQRALEERAKNNNRPQSHKEPWLPQGVDLEAAVKPPMDDDISIPVHYMYDEVARLYQSSKRAENEYGTLSVQTRYCVALARYAQSPLNEYASLGSDIVAVTFNDEAQNLIPKEKLLTALERSLVNIVNVVGVDINRAVHDPYYQHLLPFVSGLGPRKAQSIVKKITASGNLITRAQFIKDGIMTTQIFLNAAGFLRIPQDRDYKPPKHKQGETPDWTTMPDPLDGTRVHPEDYDLARKMAVDALEVDEEDYADEHPSSVVTLFLKNDQSTKERQLELLSLDDFAQNLLTTQNEKKRQTLDLVRQELLHPYADNRPEFILPTDWQALTMMSGETPNSLKLGLIVSAQVFRVKQHYVLVRLASNLEAVINATYLTDSTEHIQPERLVKPGQVIRGMLIGLDPKWLYIELSTRQTELGGGDELYRRVEIDEAYDVRQAERDRELLERRKRQQNNKSRRVIKHPNFHNMRTKEAEEYLSKQQRGDVVIRPSSQGPDHLAVTWRVDKGIYQHIDVLEVLVDPNDPMAGYRYQIGDRHFSDLDELIVNYVKAMSRKVDELMAHEKYKHQKPAELKETLEMFIRANPDKSIYAFCLDPDHPGYFKLMFIANSRARVVDWSVKVTPEAYVFFGQPLPSVPQLCDAFKMRVLAGGVAKQQQRLPGGMTPAHGGRTPGHATPGLAHMTPAPIGGKTPNPYGNPLPTPNPYAPPLGQLPHPVTANTGFMQPPIPGVTSGPQLTGYGLPPQTPSWGAPPSVPSNRGPQMNPARAAMIQNRGGGGSGNGGGGWGR